MENLLELTRSWRNEAGQLRERYGDEPRARLCEAHADELERAVQNANDELLNLQQAAAESGYSAEHLDRLVREGTIPNAGRKNAPKIRRGDLPLKRILRQSSSIPIFYESRTDRIARAIVTGER